MSIGVIILSTLARVAWAQAENTPEYRERLVANKKYPEAFEAYRQASAKDPTNPSLLYNTGLMAYLSGKPKEAIAPWRKLKEFEPDDWQVRSKLIQAYEAAGQKKHRDEERAALLKLRKESKDKDLKKVKFYNRDQFGEGDLRIIALEYFELEGDKPIRLSFVVTTPEGESTQTRYTLGSYDVTNEIAREHLQKNGKPSDRLWHLDAYKQDGNVHELYEMFIGEPDYDRVKSIVREILQGKRKPASSSSAP
jgi:tetratricopeptide (TPR) repeat protein